MDSSELKRSALSGFIWKFMERIGAQAVSLLVSIVLARLLTPDDYSVVGIVSIFFTFCNVFITSGFNTALVRKKDAQQEDYSSVLHISTGFAVLLYIVLFITAPIIAKLYNKPVLVPVFRVMGLTLIVNAVKSVLCAYISNKLQFKKFFMATLGGTVISAFVGIAMAIKGFGPWALVAQNMTNSVIDTLILFLSTRFRVLFVVSWKRLKDLFSFGWKVFVASIISTIYDEANPLIIGIKYSGADLSFYTKGRSYPAMLNSTLNGTLSAVLLPVMSKVQDDRQKVLEYTRRFIKTMSFLVFPVMVGFAAVSDNFVIVLFTERWLPAATYIKVFCINYMFSIIQDGNLQTIRAIGRSDVILRLEILKKSLYAATLTAAVLLAESPEVLAMTVLINMLIATVINTSPNSKLIGYGIGKQMLDILPNLLVSAVMGVAIYAMNNLPLPTIATLSIQILSGMAIYILLNLLIKNPNLKYVWTTIKAMLLKK